MTTQTRETQTDLTPAAALTLLCEGNARFQAGSMASRDLVSEVGVTAQGQFPFAVLLSCIDSRVSAELIRAVSHATKRHLVVVVTLTDVALLDRVARPPESTREAYGNAVAADALLLRDRAISRLRTAGVRVVDSPADRIAADAVEAYLRVRTENRV